MFKPIRSTAASPFSRLVVALAISFVYIASSWSAPVTTNPLSAASHRILSCNIRVALTTDTLNGVGWDVRRDVCVEIMRRQKADIICMQEVLRNQMDDLESTFTEYATFGFAGPEMDTTSEEYRGIAKNPIMFLKSRYSLLAGGTYWLSETPLIGGSTSWGTARPRHANWVRLKDNQTGREFRVINLHLDHISQEARLKQIEVAISEAAQYPADFPQLFAGDFNANARNDVIKSVTSSGWIDTWVAVHGDKDAGYTTHGFIGPKSLEGKQIKPYPRIDFIFKKGPVKATAAEVIRDKIGGRYPSDHYFMSADVTF